MEKSFEIVQTPFGNFLINEHDYIGNHIKKNENWENHLYHFYSKVLDKNDVCLDIGANLGYHTIQFGKLSKKVYAFEPQPMIHNQLCANILFNNLDNIVTPYRLGLGEEEKTAQMWDIENENFGEGIYNWGGRGIEHSDSAYKSEDVREEDQIQVVSLDSLNIPQCDLIKIDIQGYEYYAIQGAIKTLTKNKPVVLIENNPLRSDLDKKVLALFSNLGYEGYRYHYDSGEDCILIHPESNKYQISLDTIKNLQKQITIIYENISSYSL